MVRTIVLTPGTGPKSGRVFFREGGSVEDRAKVFWSILDPEIRDLPFDKQTILGIHEIGPNELSFCVVRDA